MDKKTAVLGAVATLAGVGAQAAPPPPMHPALQAASYADLLKPIPNAAETLRQVNDTEATGVTPAQYYPPPPYAPPGYYPPPVYAPYPPPYAYYHHHHHHHFFRPFPHHHHHHHHHHHYGRYD